MLLITNKTIQTAEDAHLVYQIYLKRSRIECVFKFLKEGIGWVDTQIQDFQSIQNILSIFFLTAYLYVIKEQEVHDDFIILLAKIGGSKGVVSRHYIFEGVKQIMNKHRIDSILEEEKASQQTMEDMFTFGGIWGFTAYPAQTGNEPTRSQNSALTLILLVDRFLEY